MNLYYCEIGEVMDFQGVELLSSPRRERMNRYVFSEDRARCLAGGLLLLRVLGSRVSELCENAHGKPYLTDGPCFNLSHSGKYAVLGVSQYELGVDVEKTAPFDDRVAQRCYTEAELSWLYAQREKSAFYRLWTAKESIMKATGLGFAMPPETFSVLPVEAGMHIINGQKWFLKWTELPGHQVCVACAAEEDLRLIRLGKSQLIMQNTD